MSQEERGLVRISSEITLKDVVTFISMAVAMTMAWGVFGTRLTVVEKEIVYQSKTIEQQQKKLDTIENKVDKLEARVRDNEDTLQSLWTRRYNGNQP